MATKKLDNVDMGAADTGIETGAVYENIERGRDRRGHQATASAEEQKERADNLKTRGRKGCKLERISVAFSPDNYKFVRIMSSVTGMTLTEFINNILDEYREENAGDYKAAEEIYNRLSKSKTAKGK